MCWCFSFLLDMKIYSVFLVFATLMFFFLSWSYSALGFFFAYTPGSDIGFHVSHSLNPALDLSREVQYSPLFHVIVWCCIPLFGSVYGALAFVVSFLLFFFLPLAFCRLGEVVWGRGVISGIFYFLSPVSLIFLVFAIYPQGLVLCLLVFFISRLLDRGFDGGCLVLFSLCGLAHSKGLFLVLSILFVWYFLKDSMRSGIKIGFMLIIALFAILFSIQRIYSPIILFENWVGYLMFFSPPMVWLGLKFLQREDLHVRSLLLEFLFFLCLCLAAADEVYRPLLYCSALFSFFAAEEIIEVPLGLRRFYLTGIFVWWFIVFVGVLFGLFVSIRYIPYG